MLAGNIAKNLYYFQKINKLVPTVQDALQGITSGSKILVGGFGICGVPMNLIQGVKQMGVKDLTVVSNNCGYAAKNTDKADWGLAVLLRSKQIKRMVSSYVGQNPQFERQYFQGQLQLEITPQGTLAQKIRSGGAGIPAFYTATGVDTLVEQGGFPIKYSKQVGANGKRTPIILSEPKRSRVFNGRKYVEEQTIFGDFALIKAQKADTFGNLYFNKTARNFNADMATAAHCVIAEVEEIVEPGQIDPQLVHVAAVYVDRIFKSNPNCPWSEKRVQKRTSKQASQKQQTKPGDKDNEKRFKIMRRAAKQVKNGMNINLGIGIPTLLPEVLPEGIEVGLQSENGIFRVGPYPNTDKEIDPDLINAGKEAVTLLPGGSLFSSAQSFSIIRGGHLDLTILGSLQVSQSCDIANWIIPDKLVRGMGGAMDLVACGSKVIVVMQHSAKNKKTGGWDKKILDKCSFPLTAKGAVNMVITELAVFQNRNGRLVLTEIANDTTLEEVQAQTGFTLEVADNLGRF